MMVMLDAKEIWCAEATTVRSLASITMRKMTAVKNFQILLFSLPFLMKSSHHLQVKDALAVILAPEDVAHLTTHVMRAKVTVTDLLMEDSMMVILDVKEILCV
jgi:hypothetical protein